MKKIVNSVTVLLLCLAIALLPSAANAEVIGVLQSAREEASSQSNFGFPLSLVIVAAAAGIGALIVMSVRSKSARRATTAESTNRFVRSVPSVAVSVPEGAIPTSGLNAISSYSAEEDELFSFTALRSRAENLFIQIQRFSCARDVTPLIPYLTDELYSKLEAESHELIRLELYPHADRVAVLDVIPIGWKKIDGMDHIVIKLKTRLIRYVMDNNEKLVEGSCSAETFINYLWDMVRPSGIKTVKSTKLEVVNCPGCGAPVDVNKNAKCSYCGTVVMLNDNGWRLANMSEEP